MALIGVLLGWKLCHVCITRSIGILWIVYWGSLGFLISVVVLYCLGGQAGAIFVFCPPDVCCYVLVVCFWVCEYVYVVCVTRDLRFCLFCFYWLFLFFLPPWIILSCSDLFINSILLLKKKYPIIKKVWTKLFRFTFLWD